MMVIKIFHIPTNLKHKKRIFKSQKQETTRKKHIIKHKKLQTRSFKQKLLTETLRKQMEQFARQMVSKQQHNRRAILHETIEGNKNTTIWRGINERRGICINLR